MLGVLLDVSGSMRSAYSTGDTEYDASVQRTHTLFTTIANIVGSEVENHRRQEKIFVCGFGMKKPAPVCNLIPLLELLKDLRQSQPQDLVDLAQKHGAPHAERWIKKHLTDREASVLNYLLRKDKSLIPLLIKKLPEDNATNYLAAKGLTIAQHLPFVKNRAAGYEKDMVNKSEAYIHAKKIIKTLQTHFLNSLKKPIQPSSVTHVSEVMRKLLDTEPTDEAQRSSSDEEGPSSTDPSAASAVQYLPTVSFSSATPFTSPDSFSSADPYLSHPLAASHSSADPYLSYLPAGSLPAIVGYPVPSPAVQSLQSSRDPDEEGSLSTAPSAASAVQYRPTVSFSSTTPFTSPDSFSSADPYLSHPLAASHSSADPYLSYLPAGSLPAIVGYPVPSPAVQSLHSGRDPDKEGSLSGSLPECRDPDKEDSEEDSSSEDSSSEKGSESLRDCIQELVDHIEPYIYGGTPLCEAMNEAVDIFKQADSRTEKVLFILSDGESEDGDPRPIAQKLHAMGVKIVTCYLTSDDVDNPKRLLYEENPAWEAALMQMSSLMTNTYTMLTNTITVLAKTHTPEDGRDGRQTLFNMSSTMKNTRTPISYLVDAGWELPAAGASRLFIQANSMAVVNEFCETIVSQMTNGCDVLVDFLEKVSLATYINQHNADFIPKKQEDGTCYANAIAATLHLAMLRIVGREGGIPDFYTIRERIIREYGKRGAKTRRVLEKVCPEYRLHVRKVYETGARQAINQRRPVVARFRWYKEEKKNFSHFFKLTKKGILKRADVETSGPTTNCRRGHAVVLIDCDPDCLTFMNSWGTNFADKGFFRVEDQEVLHDMKFYDVYWTTDDLTHKEKEAYKIEGTKKAKEMLEKYPSLKDVKYKCPNCYCVSKVDEYFGDLLKAECPICHESFKPTIGSMLYNILYSRN